MQIHTLDLHFQAVPKTIAAYLVAGPDGLVLVETGPGSTLPALYQQLASHGAAPGDIQALIVTHIHLDHAGAAGWWAQQGVPVYVHYLGAPHLVDPTRLLASASRIYGEQMDTLWGEMLPAPASHVFPLYDGDTVEAGGLVFTAMETPGHARHHHLIRLGEIAFTGDAAGIHIPGTNWADLPAPPPEFELETWQESLKLISRSHFSAIYPTHFGRIERVDEHLARFGQLLAAAAAFVRQKMEAGLSRDEIVTQYQQWVKASATAHGVGNPLFTPYATANPHYMSVDGMMRYWRKQGLVTPVS